MKKLALIAALSVVGIANAQAADGTITINGLVTDKTCDIVTPAGKDFTVTLPTVSKQTLAVAGDVAGRTPFQINLANCSQGKVATYFEPANSQWVDVAEGASADLNYYAEYYATGASTAGKVTTSVQYTIIYQ
ncbi:fimbrial protein [Acinetobacter baumannii]